LFSKKENRRMQLTPYLLFSGHCEAAFTFYAECLGGTINALLPYEGTPAADHVSEEWRGKILHACMSVGNQMLMGSDAPPDRFERVQGFSVSIMIEDPAEGERIFNALAEGGSVTMPYAQTFWSYRFGMVTDRFDIPWMINCDKAA